MPESKFFRGAKPLFPRYSVRTVPALPTLVGECGDVPLFGFVSDYVGATLGPGLVTLTLCV
jgi:hypothetical protein